MDHFTGGLHQRLHNVAAVTQAERNLIVRHVQDDIARAFREPGFSPEIDQLIAAVLAGAIPHRRGPHDQAVIDADVFCQCYAVERTAGRLPPAVAAKTAREAVTAFRGAA